MTPPPPTGPTPSTPATPPAPATPPTDRHLLATRLGKLHVRTCGDPATAGAGGRPPLVLLHMSPQSSRMWDRVAPLLGTDRLVVMPDRIGFGNSDHPTRPLPFSLYADATMDALDALGLDRFDAFGAHTGSCEVVEIAATRPDRVRRCGLHAIPLMTPEEALEFKGHYQPQRPPQLDGSHLTDVWNWWLKWLPEEWGLDLHQRRTLDVLTAAPDYWQTYHSVFDYASTEYAGRLAGLTQPFLVLAPRDDLWELTERALPLCPPQTRVVDLPHITVEGWWRFPEELAGHLRAFLDAPG